jgi:hypothetical protein
MSIYDLAAAAAGLLVGVFVVWAMIIGSLGAAVWFVLFGASCFVLGHLSGWYAAREGREKEKRNG